MTALAGTLICLSVNGAPASAGEVEAAPIIDKPFEQAVIKHVQKRFFNRIDATADQREKLSALIDKQAESSRPLREQVRRKFLEFNKMMAAEGVTDEELIARAHEIRDMRSQLMEERLQTLIKARAVLTPAQRKQISDRIAGGITGQWKTRLTAAL